MNTKILKVANIIGLVFTLFMNFLAGSGIIFKNTIGDVSDKYSNLFTPAGFAFSIWGLIYFMLVLFVIFQFKEENDQIVEDIGILFIILSILNPIWLIVWVLELIILSLIVMLLLLGNLIMIYLKLEIGKIETSIKKRFFVNTTFSLYLGWISIATIANTTIFLVSMNWNALGIEPVIWTIIIIIVALILTSIVLILRSDVPYALVFVWASFGIIVRRMATNPEISNMALVAIIIILCEMVLILLLKFKKKE